MKTIRRYMFFALLLLAAVACQPGAGAERGAAGLDYGRADMWYRGGTAASAENAMCFTSRPAIGDGRMPTAPCIGRWMCTIPCSVPICRRRSDWPSACSPKATVSTRLITGRLPWSRGSSPIRLSGQGSPWRWKMYGRLSVTIWSTSTGAGLSYWRDTAREPVRVGAVEGGDERQSLRPVGGRLRGRVPDYRRRVGGSAVCRACRRLARYRCRDMYQQCGGYLCALSALSGKPCLHQSDELADGCSSSRPEENLGTLFLNPDGTVARQVEPVTARIDTASCTLIVDGLVPEEHFIPAIAPVAPLGNYHVQELNIYFGNLRHNVARRVRAYYEEGRAARFPTACRAAAVRE